MNLAPKYLFYLLMLSLIFSGNAYSGKLDDFRTDVYADVEVEKKDSEQISIDGSDLLDPANEGYIGMAALLLLAGGMWSNERINPQTTNEEDEDFLQPRKNGEALIPYLSLNAAHRNVDKDFIAHDYNAEIGYGAFSILYSKSYYRDDNSSGSLDIEQYYILYRASLGAYLEIDLGYGETVIDDELFEESITIPIRIHPNENWGIEFRPAWAGTTIDYDTALMFGMNHISLKVGYRSVRSDNVTLDGPYVGLSMRL